jgi:hypothetical protein
MVRLVTRKARPGRYTTNRPRRTSTRPDTGADEARCGVCDALTHLTPTARMLAKHLTPTGDVCTNRNPQARPVVLTELPPVMHRGKPVDQAPQPRQKMVTGYCHDCGQDVTGERWYCGLCAARRDTERPQR